MRLGRTKIGRALLVGAAAIAVALGIVWTQRMPIAADAIDRALAARGIRARYEIRHIGFRTQRIEKLRLGNPVSPDLTADWVEVSLTPRWGGVTVTTLAAGRVRLRGRIVQGRVTWGEVDQLLPAPTGKPLTLPEIDVRLADTQVQVATDLGAFTADIAGSGKLSNGFSGRVRVAAPFAGRDVCRFDRPVAAALVTISQHRPHLAGTIESGFSTCGGVRARPLRGRFDVTLSEAFDRWTGQATAGTRGLRLAALQMAQASAQVDFAGNVADTKGQFVLLSSAARYGTTRLAGLAAKGSFSSGDEMFANGRLNIARVIADPNQIAAVRRAFAGAEGTPVGPIADSLAKAVGRAGAGASIAAAFAFRDGAVRLSDGRVAAQGGGLLTLSNGDVVIDSRGVSADADMAVSGGGFPAARGRLSRASDGSTRGLFTFAPFRSGSAQLVLAPVRFAARRDGTMRIETVAVIDGPIADGRVEGLRLPLVAQRASSGAYFVAPGCTPVEYGRVLVAGTSLLPGRVQICPTNGGAILRGTPAGIGGGARTGPLRLNGRVGDQPLLLTAKGASFEIGGPLSLADFSASLGAADRRTQIRIVKLDGVAGTRGLSGRYTGLSGSIAQVPFLASAGKGNWALTGGMLDVEGAVTVADQAMTARFNPLSAQGVKLRLKDGRIVANATVFEPVSARAIANVSITHNLSDSVGEARLTVDALMFSKSLQPEAITPLTEGVIADVYGQIDGSGLVRWNGDRLTSTGKFRTAGVDFAAAFGPVTGASGEIEFDDLIALSTPPGQQVKLALVNPGVEVKDGVITYRLRPNQVVEIERGRWPFAGGELLLDPGTLDLGQTKARRMSFRVVGLDAAKFIEQLKLENIAATGTFDGVLPIVFDASGGQIVGGQIVARAGGGTLAYVGDVSNAETNTLAKLAFDALKSIRYGNLAIDLDGSLDGEIVSLVRFDGVNQSPVAPSGLAKSFTGLPFKFNIRVRAPFRGLVNTARSYQDPGLLLNRTVQPAAIGKRP